MKKTLRIAGLCGLLFFWTGWPGLFAGAPQHVSQRLSQQAMARLSQTTLKVQWGSGDVSRWEKSLPISDPYPITFLWTTKKSGVVATRWQVTDKPVKLGGASEQVHAYASAALPSVPAPDKASIFVIDFRTFAPARAPQPPYTLNYYVQVVLLDAHGTILEYSPPATVIYQAPGPPTQFDENMSSPPDTNANALLMQAYGKLKPLFQLQDPLDDIRSGPNLPALRHFQTPGGPASLELHYGPTRVYLCVPRLNLGNQVAAYQWFEYQLNFQYGWVAAPERDQDPPPDQLPPVLAESGAWAGYEAYNVELVMRGDDPPHWTPILINNDSHTIAEIHRMMQFSAGQSLGATLLGYIRDDVKQQDLTDRAMESWQSVKLCGIIEDAFWPGEGDLGADHTTNYNDGSDAPSGGWCSESDPNSFPGVDWNIRVNPDPAYNYLASIIRSTILVEIEHFALTVGSKEYINYTSYFPQVGEWLQAVGRWVTDNGHPGPEDSPDWNNGFYTEIHPPEMLATSRMMDAFTAETRLTVTGAWRGYPLTFVVNPPPRPSATARLKYGIYRIDNREGQFDRKDKSDLQLAGRGNPANPCYVLGTVTKTGPAPLILYNSGMVGMNGSRGLQCVVRCWWDEPSASLSGRLIAGNKPASGAYMFYRDAAVPTAGWQIVAVDGSGRYSLPRLVAGKSYWIRPAGSGWNFRDVPRKFTPQSGNNILDFQADPIPPGQPAIVPASLQRAFRRAVSHIAEPSSPQPVQPADAARQVLQSMLVILDEPTHGNFGVYKNGLGYREDGHVHVQLLRLLGWDDQPVSTFESAYKVGGTPQAPTIQIQGIPGQGVPQARIRARLILGNLKAGYRLAQEVVAVTSGNGVAAFKFEAGAHVEDAMIEYQVLENPVNPWFKPGFSGNLCRFFPADKRGDVWIRAVPLPGRGSSETGLYTLKALDPLSPLSFRKDFMREVHERDSHLAAFRKLAIKEKMTVQAMKAKFKKHISRDD